ncbi:hypothetical protein NEUTE2DRAFT_55490 [Neurospora tetrasperma FGSC 2509]|nr:hypothetical protein NEUTE2DRAFT_55490 [Neurospora tetrasperma FGSC 2509]
MSPTIPNLGNFGEGTIISQLQTYENCRAKFSSTIQCAMRFETAELPAMVGRVTSGRILYGGPYIVPATGACSLGQSEKSHLTLGHVVLPEKSLALSQLKILRSLRFGSNFNKLGYEPTYPDIQSHGSFICDYRTFPINCGNHPVQ